MSGRSYPAATLDYTSFYTEWQPKVRSLLASKGIFHEDMDDAVQDIFTYLCAGHYLEKYDPNRGPFHVYMFGMIRVRIAEFIRDRVNRYKRETAMANLLTEDNQQEMDVADTQSPDPISLVEAREALEYVQECFTELQRLPSTPTKNLARLFADYMEQVEQIGECNATAVAAKYGYTRQAINQQTASLRATPAMHRLHEALTTLESRLESQVVG